MSTLAALRVIVHGRVQGVNFRAFVSKRASQFGLTGYVRNLPGGRSVEVQAEGEKANLEKLIDQLKVGPSGAVVENIESMWSEYTGKYSHFKIKYF